MLVARMQSLDRRVCLSVLPATPAAAGCPAHHSRVQLRSSCRGSAVALITQGSSLSASVPCQSIAAGHKLDAGRGVSNTQQYMPACRKPCAAASHRDLSRHCCHLCCRHCLLYNQGATGLQNCTQLPNKRRVVEPSEVGPAKNGACSVTSTLRLQVITSDLTHVTSITGLERQPSACSAVKPDQCKQVQTQRQMLCRLL